MSAIQPPQNKYIYIEILCTAIVCVCFYTPDIYMRDISTFSLSPFHDKHTYIYSCIFIWMYVRTSYIVYRKVNIVVIVVTNKLALRNFSDIILLPVSLSRFAAISIGTDARLISCPEFQTTLTRYFKLYIFCIYIYTLDCMSYCWLNQEKKINSYIFCVI